MKKVLAIMGSPRKNKNTDIILDYLIEGIDKKRFEIEKIYLGDLNIEHCTGCDYCGHKGICVKKDDMNNIYSHIDRCDILIFAAPLYFNTINGLAKNMVDRCQMYWSKKYSLGENYKRGEDRKGIFLSTGGAPYTHEQFHGIYPILDFFYKSVNIEYIGNYLISNTDKIPLKDRMDVKEELYYLGQNIDNISPFTIQK